MPLTGADEYEAETFFPMLGMAIRVVNPGEPTDTYHWETEQEDFLVLSGEALLIVEGQERRLRQWDFVHCPPETRHAFVGAGDGPCVLLCASSRQFQKDGPWGFYCADETAARYNASPPEDTQDNARAYARFEPPQSDALPRRAAAWRTGVSSPSGEPTHIRREWRRPALPRRPRNTLPMLVTSVPVGVESRQPVRSIRGARPRRHTLLNVPVRLRVRPPG